MTNAIADKPSVTIEQIVERYVLLRDRKAVLKKAYDKSVEDIEAGLDKLENFLLKRLQEQGADSIKTPAGTAYLTTKTNASIGDWDVFRRFLERQDDPYMYLDRKANKTAIEAFKTEHQDLPPGVNWNEIRAVGIRRA